MTETLRLSFLVLFAVVIAVFLIMAIRFRWRRTMVERKIGPLPTPIPLVVKFVAVLILLTRTGEASGPSVELKENAKRLVGVLSEITEQFKQENGNGQA